MIYKLAMSVALSALCASALGAVRDVSNSTQLRQAMKNANSGDIINIGSGVYQPGDIVVQDNGENIKSYSGQNGGIDRNMSPRFALVEKNNITIKAANPSARPTLKGDGINDGRYILYIKGSNNITIENLNFENGRIAIVADRSDNIKIINNRITRTGNEAIHLRDGSDGGLIKGNTISGVGYARKDRGEAIYICNDKKKWHPNYTSGTGDDIYLKNCDNTIIENNTVGPNIGAEHIDIKEGVSGTIVRNNTFVAGFTDSSLISANGDFPKSVIHDKGAESRIHNNFFNLSGMRWEDPTEANGAIRLEQILDESTDAGWNVYGHRGAYVYNEVTNASSSNEFAVFSPGRGGIDSKVGCNTLQGNDYKYFKSGSRSEFDIDDQDSSTPGYQSNTGNAVVSNCDSYVTSSGGSSTSSTGSTSSGGSTSSSSGGYTGSVNLPGTIQAQNYANANDTSAGRNGGTISCTYHGLDVDIQNTSDSSGVCNIGWTASGEWTEYKVGSAGGTYDIKLRLSANSSGKRVQVLVNGSSIGTVTANNNGWNGWHTKTISGKSIPSNATIRVRFLDGGVNLNFISITAASTSSTSSSSTSGSTSSSSGSAGYNNDMNSGSGLGLKHLTASYSSGQGTYTLNSGNNDPYIRFNSINVNASDYTHVEFRVKNNTTGTAWRVYFNPGSGEAGNSIGKTVSQSGSWTVYSVNMTSDPDWSGTINSIRIDPQGQVGGNVVFDWVRVTGPGSTSTSSSGSTSSSSGGTSGDCLSYTYDSGLKELSFASGSGGCVNISGGNLQSAGNVAIADSDANASCNLRGTATGSGGGSHVIDGNWETPSNLSGNTLNINVTNNCKHFKLRVMAP